jgi:glycosyltransferase involved in cell wall biosynthesis
MHLLFVTRESHPSHRADIAVLFGKYLPRLGVTSDLVAQRAGDAVAPWGGGEAVVGRPSRLRGLNVVRGFFHAVRALARGRGNCDAIQVRDNSLVALVALIVARRRGMPLFYWMSFPIVESNLELAAEGPRRIGWARYLYALAKGHVGSWILYRWVLPNADHVFVQSDRMAEDMAARGVHPGKMTAVPMGVDLESAEPGQIASADDPRLSGKRVVIYLGTLERARRIELLFEMLAIVRGQMPDILLVLAGDTPDAGHKAWLMARMRALGVEDQVLWTGWLPMQAAWRYVRAAEVGLSPIPRSRLFDCGSPTKAIEYMAFGLPVLANDQPDQSQVLAESGAGICVPLTPEAFAKALTDMLGSPDKLAAWRKAGRPYVEARRSYQVISAELASVYRALAAEGSR